MTSDDRQADSVASLQRLTIVRPDAARAARVRLRCRRELERGRRRRARRAAIGGFTWRLLAVVAVGGFGVLYVVVLVANTLRLRGAF